MQDNNALQKREKQAVAHRTQNPLQALHERFDEGRFNLLLPKIHMGSLPEGTLLAVREVHIQPNEPGMYKVDGGKQALGKAQLNRIAAAAGITWVSVERTDDRKHPHYCEVTARACVTDFDGTARESVGTKTIDMRADAVDGQPGPELDAMLKAAARNNRDASKQIEQQRKFIAEICASKAMNRAIADVLAIRRSYEPKELAKPFIVPKLVPDTSNPVAQNMVLAQMTGAANALYGRPQQQPPTVVDATLDDAPEPATDEVGEQVELPDFDYDLQTGEVTEDAAPPSPEDIKKRLGAAYSKIRKAHPAFTDQAWRSLVKAATGKSGYTDLSWNDLLQVEMAADAHIANISGGDE
jgi:hypothetical protein